MIDDIRLPESIEQGAKGGPNYNTTIVATVAGKEKRNSNWQYPQHSYDVGYGIEEAVDYEAVLAFFHARKGKFYGFRFKDWADFVATGQAATALTATTFQITRVYGDAIRPMLRPITHPVVGTVVVYVDGVAASGWTLGALGVITFASAPAGTVTVDFEFDVPVRFDIDHLELELPTVLAATITGINIVELKL